VHQRAKYAQKVKGLRAKLFNKKRFQEKADMKKTYARNLSGCLACISS
jgi:ribosome biogenesis protein NSA2